MSAAAADKLWGLLNRSQRRRVWLLLGPMFVGMAMEALSVGLIVPLIALFTQPDYAHRYPALQPVLAALGNPDHVTLVVGSMLALIVVYAIKAAFLAFLAWQQTSFAYGVQAQLSQRLFTAYLRRPYPFHLQRNSAQLLRNLTAEVSALVNSALIPGMLLMAEALVLIGLLTLLLFVEPLGATLVILALGAAAGGFHWLTRRRIARWGTARQHHEGLRIQHLQQGLGGVKDVKLLGCEQEFSERYRPHNFKSAHVAHLQATLQQLPRLWLELLAVSGLALLVITMVARGRELASVLPTLALFAAAAFRLMPSANRVISGIQALRYGLPAIEVLHTELSAVTQPDDASAAAITGVELPFRRDIQLEGVTYTYPGAAQPALRELSVTIHSGQIVGFIGASGAGKSTLVDLILGLLSPDAGSVRIDGHDMRGNPRSWQNQIGYVPQTIYLTDDSLLHNVAFGVPRTEIDEAAVWRALRAAQMEEFVRSLPEGLQTSMGERGVRLSGGQRQRIGIARALYRDPKVLFLDEATSALDTATERGVMQAVLALRGSKTIIIVAHRMSTVESCDRLYRLDHGRVVEQGSPQAMLQLTTSAH
ncbi:ABC transporter ATP-binding protein [Steroidobacter flavus]|uniref:ABC transporter ATP-binding protein n=1 Tax=Steroidobacter flavus TaxID=1842136 RepID=A0ABV8T146_9GAMM